MWEVLVFFLPCENQGRRGESRFGYTLRHFCSKEKKKKILSQDKRTDNFSRRSFARARIGCRNFFFFFFCCSILGDRLCYRLRDFPVRGGTVWRPSLQWRQTSSQKRQLRQSGVNVRRVKVVLPHFQLRREREKEKVVSCVSLSLLVYSCC